MVISRHGLVARAQLVVLEESFARMVATLRQLLADAPLDPAVRQMAPTILAQAEERLTVIRALLERGLYVD